MSKLISFLNRKERMLKHERLLKWAGNKRYEFHTTSSISQIDEALRQHGFVADLPSAEPAEERGKLGYDTNLPRSIVDAINSAPIIGAPAETVEYFNGEQAIAVHYFPSVPVQAYRLDESRPRIVPGPTIKSADMYRLDFMKNVGEEIYLALFKSLDGLVQSGE